MENLKLLRKRKNITQKQMADLLKISVNHYQRYEYGTSQADYQTLKKISNYFNVTIDYLLGRSNFKTETEKQKKFNELSDQIELYKAQHNISDKEVLTALKMIAEMKKLNKE